MSDEGKEEFFDKLHEVEATVAAAEEFQALIDQASESFDVWCQQRHTEGARKYGPVKFLSVNSIEEAMAEVVDLANYARYTYIRLFLMNQMMDQNFGQEVLGQNKFVANAEKFGSGS